MVSRNIGADIRPGFETEVSEAIGFVTRKGGAATDEEVQDWINRHIDAAVFKYRDSKRPDISREKPTVARSPGQGGA